MAEHQRVYRIRGLAMPCRVTMHCFMKPFYTTDMSTKLLVASVSIAWRPKGYLVLACRNCTSRIGKFVETLRQWLVSLSVSQWLSPDMHLSLAETRCCMTCTRPATFQHNVCMYFTKCIFVEFLQAYRQSAVSMYQHLLQRTTQPNTVIVLH